MCKNIVKQDMSTQTKNDPSFIIDTKAPNDILMLDQSINSVPPSTAWATTYTMLTKGNRVGTAKDRQQLTDWVLMAHAAKEIIEPNWAALSERDKRSSAMSLIMLSSRLDLPVDEFADFLGKLSQANISLEDARNITLRAGANPKQVLETEVLSRFHQNQAQAKAVARKPVEMDM